MAVHHDQVTALKTGKKATEVYAYVGTVSSEHGCWVAVCSHNGNVSAFPTGVRPVVTVEYPPQTRGGQAVKKRYELDQFC